MPPSKGSGIWIMLEISTLLVFVFAESAQSFEIGPGLFPGIIE